MSRSLKKGPFVHYKLNKKVKLYSYLANNKDYSDNSTDKTLGLGMEVKF